MTTEAITISFLGIDERSKSAYQVFFKNINQGQYVLIDDYTKAQLCLVDKDSYNIHQHYDELINNYPDNYILLLSVQEQSCTNDKEIFLRKPVKRDSLQNSLDKISRLISNKNPDKVIPFQKAKTVESNPPVIEIKESVSKKNIVQEKTVTPIKKNQSKKKKNSTAKVGKLLKFKNQDQFIGEQSDIDIDKPEQLKKIIYSPDKLLQTIVEQACIKSKENEKIIQINILNHIFYFDSKEQKIYSTVGPGTIRPLCLIKHDNRIVFTEKENSFRTELHKILKNNKKKTVEKQSWSMESFIWLIALWSSRGRVPQETDLKKPVYLTQWPNLTRLASIPYAVNVAALLYSQPYLLTDAAKQLGIKQRYVFGFYSASKAIGLAGTSHRKVDKLFKPEKSKQNKNQFILSKLLGKLVNFSSKPKIITA